MAQISVGAGGHGGRKSVDADIPLIPFIDLLLCCVMFLLVSAVWNELAAIQVNQALPGATSADTLAPETQRLVIAVHRDGYEVGSTLGEATRIPKNGEVYDEVALVRALEQYRRGAPNVASVIVTSEDGVRAEPIVNAMDAVRGVGYREISLSDAAPL
jgi:biopolymer transport protein ExbD